MSLLRKRLDAYFLGEKYQARLGRSCATCGGTMTHTDDPLHCSPGCVPEQTTVPAFLPVRPATRIAGFRANAERRAWPGVDIEDVDPVDVLDVHGWLCHLCARPIPRDVHFRDPEAATVDHVVPLARGGMHTYANMRPAHRRCNISKNDRWQG
ncbi:hypothetical protein CTZ27_37345 [Streptomyces griseocarneus]|nr:hypothetical protein CTZ27_37345 [Streptomyces griseocarneus]